MLPVFRSARAGILFATIAVVGMDSFAQQSGTTPQEHARRANEFLKANEPAKAIPEFEALVAAQPDNLDAQANLGVLLYFQGRHSEAEGHLRRAIQINPNLPKIQALLGLC